MKGRLSFRNCWHICVFTLSLSPSLSLFFLSSRKKKSTHWLSTFSSRYISASFWCIEIQDYILVTLYLQDRDPMIDGKNIKAWRHKHYFNNIKASVLHYVRLSLFPLNWSTARNESKKVFRALCGKKKKLKQDCTLGRKDWRTGATTEKIAF